MELRHLLRLWLIALVVGVACQTEVKRPLAVAGPDQTNVQVGVPVQLDGSGSSDPQLLPLVYRWTFAGLPPGSKAKLVGPNTAMPTFVPDLTGSYQLQLVVSNGTAASDPAVVNVTAGKCGANAPVIDSVAADPAMPDVGKVVALSAKVSHADVTSCMLTRVEKYAWKVTKAPPGSTAALLGATTATPSIVVDKSGDWEITLVVTDDLGHASAPKAVAFTAGLCGNNPPVVGMVTANPATPNMGTPVMLAATVTDADTMAPCSATESFSYSWQILQLPLGSHAGFNLATASNPTFTPDVAGDYVVGVTVTDIEGHGSGLATLDIKVAPCGENPPTISAITATPAAPNAFQTVTLSASVSDADTQPPCSLSETFSYQWSFAAVPPGSKAVLTATNEANPSFTPDLTGAYLVQLVVTDSEGHASAVKQLPVNTTKCGAAAPVAMVSELVPNAAAAKANLTGQPVGLNQVVQVSAAGSTDADTIAPCNLGETFSYMWFFQERPAGSNATLNDRTILNPSFTTDTPGKYVLAVTVTDSNGQSSATPATFTVIADPAVNIDNLPAGFNVTSIIAGGAQGVSHPRGITKDCAPGACAPGTGNIYWANSGNGRIRKLSSTGFVSNFATGLNDPFFVTYDGVDNLLFVSQNLGGGGNAIVSIDSNGNQNNCRNGNYRGVKMYTTANGTNVLIAADRGGGGGLGQHVEFINPTNCAILVTNDMGGIAPFGVCGVVRNTGSLVDDIFADDRNGGGNGDLVRNEGANVLAGNNAGNNTTIVNNGLQEPSDVTTTPCTGNGHPKVVVADTGNDRIVVVDDAQNGNVQVLAAGFNNVVGLFFEDANDLLVTDSGFNAVMRITGNFCSL